MECSVIYFRALDKRFRQRCFSDSFMSRYGLPIKNSYTVGKKADIQAIV